MAESQSHHSQSNFVVLLFLVFIISFFVWHTVVQWPVILTSDTVLLASTNPGAETVRYHVPLFFILLFVSVGFYFLCPSLFFIVFSVLQCTTMLSHPTSRCLNKDSRIALV